MKKPVIFLFIFALVAAGGLSAEEADGGYAGAFLQVPIGARPTALGGAYRAVSNDGAASFYNPAGISSLQRPMFASSYRLMQLDRKLGYAAFMIPVQGEAVVGARWLYAGSGSVEVRDSDGELLGRDFSINNHEFAIIFAKRFETYLSLGANLKYLYSRIPEVGAATVGFDLGVMLHVDYLFNRERRETMAIRDIQIGLVARNLGSHYNWNSEAYDALTIPNPQGREQDDDVPAELGLGASARFIDRKLLVAADVSKNEEQEPVFRAGAEYFVRPEFSLRAGYGDGYPAAGTGYIFKIGNSVLAIDYAFSAEKADEGSEHIFSFDLLF
jgi:hypothetical protein